MFQLLELVKIIITCTLVFLTVNSQEFEASSSKEHETLYPSLKKQTINQGQLYTRVNPNPYFTAHSSESDEELPTFKSKYLNHPKDSEIKLDTILPHVPVFVSDEEILITGQRSTDRPGPYSLLHSHRSVQELNENMSEIPGKSFIRSSHNFTALLNNELSSNNMPVTTSTIRNYTEYAQENFDTSISQTTAHQQMRDSVDDHRHDISSPIFNEHSSLKENKNNVVDVSDKPVLGNSVNPSDRLSSGSLKNNTIGHNVNRTTTTNVTVDDRASFEGAKCPTGLVKVQGQCVPPD